MRLDQYKQELLSAIESKSDEELLEFIGSFGKGAIIKTLSLGNEWVIFVRLNSYQWFTTDFEDDFCFLDDLIVKNRQMVAHLTTAKKIELLRVT